MKRATCPEGNSKCDRYQIRSLELVEFPVPISAFFVPVAGRHCLSTCWCSWHLRGSGFLREHRMLAEQLQVHSSAQAGPPKRALSSWNPRNTDKFHSEDNIRGYPGDLCPEAVIPHVPARNDIWRCDEMRLQGVTKIFQIRPSRTQAFAREPAGR